MATERLTPEARAELRCDTVAFSTVEAVVPLPLVTCSLWRHGCASRLAHVHTAECVNPVPAAALRGTP